MGIHYSTEKVTLTKLFNSKSSQNHNKVLKAVKLAYCNNRFSRDEMEIVSSSQSDDDVRFYMNLATYVITSQIFDDLNLYSIIKSFIGITYEIAFDPIEIKILDANTRTILSSIKPPSRFCLFDMFRRLS
jgi:hypothetical protein